MNTQILEKIGLSDVQITIYTALLEHGDMKAGALSKKTPLKRGLVYKVLEDLAEFRLIEKDDTSGKVAVYRAKHPNALKDFTKKKADELSQAETLLTSEIGTLTSAYNLANSKPGVEFYEGEAGARKALMETLETQDVIYTYADIEAIDRYIPKINSDYMKERLRRGVKKKLLFVDTEYLRSDMDRFAKSAHTESRVIKNEDAPPFQTALEIHGGKVTYITFAHEKITATIISDKSIYDFHRYLFEYTWERSQTLR